MDYKIWMEKHYADICKQYDLSVHKAGDRVYALVGHGFMVLFTLEIDDVVVSYIRRDIEEQLLEWYLDSYIMNYIHDEDRIGLQDARSVKEMKQNAFLIVERVLKRDFTNLLQGDTAWMNQYLTSKYARKPRVPRSDIKAFAEERL